jgi:hypothetical protein
LTENSSDPATRWIGEETVLVFDDALAAGMSAVVITKPGCVKVAAVARPSRLFLGA